MQKPPNRSDCFLIQLKQTVRSEFELKSNVFQLLDYIAIL